jgi:hypothetical protein
MYRGLDRFAVVTDEKSAERSAADHQQFQRLEQGSEVSARHCEAAEYRGADNHISDDD